MYCFPNPPKLQSTTTKFNFHAVPRQVLLIALAVPTTNALHHMMRREPSNDLSVRAETRPLSITNSCQETIYPGIVTQTGIAPSVGGFQLLPGASRNFTVSGDWQGRVWGRTNCSFNSAGTGPSSGGYGKACSTGDCGGIIDCKATVGSESGCLRSTAKSVKGEIPVTLAEFTLSSASSQTFYDISLVDGYNIPMAIISLYPESGNSKLTEIPPNLTNPICIGTAALLAEAGSLADENLGTNSSFPIPLDQALSFDDVQKWCPWDLMLNPPTKPSDGIYPYPDDNLQRPFFNPCFSACAKYNRPLDCCTGKYNSPNICKPSSYSTYAKKVCPDAYSFAFDDQTSTFIIPSGGGFEVVFCPTGRSSTILATKAAELHQLSQTGHVTTQLLAEVAKVKVINRNSGFPSSKKRGLGLMQMLAVTAMVLRACF